MSTTSDHDLDRLVSRWQAGEARAGEALYERYGSAIKRYFRRHVSQVEDIADLVQETFLRLRTVNYRGEGTIRGLLFGIAHNVFLEYLRRRNRQAEERALRGDILEWPAADYERNDPEYRLAQKDETRLIMKAMRRISLRYQIVLELSGWEGLKQAEIAAVLSKPGAPVPSSTIGRWKSEALAALAAKVRELADSPELGEATTMTLSRWRRSILDRSANFDAAARAQGAGE